MKKILITGSTGDVGKALTDYLIKQNYNVFGLTINKKKSDKEINGNLSDYYSLLNATKNIDIVIHLAGAIKGNKKILKKVNVNGTQNLISACEKNKVKKIIFISSLDVKFNTSYGISKLKAEEIIKNSKLDYVILRPSVLYGKKFTKGINSLIKIIKRFPLIPIFGSGNNLYQPLYIEDLILLIKQIIDRSKFNNKIYFVSGAEEISMNQLVDLIVFNLNKKIIKIHFPGLLEKIFLKSENYKLNKIENNELIKKDFDFNPIPIKMGLKKMM